MTHFTRQQHVSRVVETVRKGDDGRKPVTIRKGLYDVSRLASILGDLSYLRDSAKREAAQEGDGSGVPGKLQAAVDALADVLKEMAAEEASEAAAGNDDSGGKELCAAVDSYYRSY